jgi:hypothetical protein
VWRVLFSSVEAELGLPSLGRVLVFPTRDPETLRHELEDVAAEV